jgi:recombination protein RecT
MPTKAKKEPKPETQEQRISRIAKSEERGMSLAQMWTIAEPRIKVLVPQHVTTDRMLASLLTAVNRNPDLQKCSPVSLIRETIRGAQMGFDVSGIGGKFYLVPFWNGAVGQHEAQGITGYRGLEELARRTGQIAAIWSREVYQHEDFAYEDGMIQSIRHVPQGPKDENDQPVGAYAVALWANGFRQGEVMNKVQLEKIRQMSKLPDGLMWKNHRAEAYRKTVTRRLCKRLPDSIELLTQLDNEDRLDRGDVPVTTISIDDTGSAALPSAQKTRTEKLKEQLSRSDDAPANDEPDERQQGFDGMPGDDDNREPGQEG